MDLAQLNQLLEKQSYVGNEAGATLEDYAKAAEIKSVDAAKFPHVARWHAHITYVAQRFPTTDWRGNPLAKGNAAPAQAKGGKASPKASPKAAPKAEEKKKEAKPKQEPKKGGKAEEKKDAAPAEKTPAQLAEDRKKQLKKVIKEGGKRGVEIEGAADMGGLQYFCTSMDEPGGDLEFLEESMTAMNAKSDPTEEERKGGSGKIGKMIFSAGNDQLAVIAYVPEDMQKENDASAWLKHVLGMFGGEFVKGDKGLAVGKVLTDSNKGIFPLKVKEPGIMEAISYLKKKGLFPDKDDSDDDYVFGDDDFPS